MTSAATAHDPICHMDIDPASAAGSSAFEGATYYFCSPGCQHDFDEDPARALADEAAFDHSQPVMDAMGTTAGRKPWWKFWG